MRYLIRFVFKDDTVECGFRVLYRYADNKETADKYAGYLNEVFGEDGFANATVEEMPLAV